MAERFLADEGETEALGEDASNFLKPKSPEVHKKFDELLAAADGKVMAQLQMQLQPFAQPVMQAFQELQKQMPPPPMDPSQATLKVGMAEIQRKAQYDQQDMQLKSQAQQASQQQSMQQLQLQNQKLQLELQRLQTKHQEQQSTLESREYLNAEDNSTAMDIAILHHAAGVTQKTGEGIDPGKGISQTTSIGNGAE